MTFSASIAREVIEYLVTVLRSERSVMQAKARLQYTSGALFLAERSHLLARPVLEELKRSVASEAQRISGLPPDGAPRVPNPTRRRLDSDALRARAVDLLYRQLIMAGAERDLAEPYDDIEAVEGVAYWQADALIWAFAELSLLDEDEYKEWLAMLHD